MAARSRADASAGGKAAGCGTAPEGGSAPLWTTTAVGSAASELGPAEGRRRLGNAPGAGTVDGAENGVTERPGGGIARAPGERKPWATAAVRTHRNAAALSSIARHRWEGMIVLVAGPQGGAGISG